MAEDHSKWDGENGALGTVPQWGSGAKTLVARVWGTSPPKADDTILLKI